MGTVRCHTPERLEDIISMYTHPSKNSRSGTRTITDILVDLLMKQRATRLIDVFSLGYVF
jgi:hypothetical protein